jgi:acyl carrier protein
VNDNRSSSGGVTAAAGTPTQAALIDIWKQILWVPDLEAHDNFIDLGGHSLTATRCINRIRVQFKVDVPLDAFFMEPGDIASIAELIDNVRTARG